MKGSVEMSTIKDIIGASDQVGQIGGLRGELIFGYDPKVERFTDPFGNESYRTTLGEVLFKDKNIVPIGGYQYVFSKLFNIAFDDPQRSNLAVGYLNNNDQMMMGVSDKSKWQSPSYTAETSDDKLAPPRSGVNISGLDYVFGFMVGDGGAREDNITAITPDYKRRNLYHPVPFRIETSDDKTTWTTPTDKYFGKIKDAKGNTLFYIKLFETEDGSNTLCPHIVHAWVTDNDDLFDPVDSNVFASTSSTPIESYVEMFLKIDAADVKDYFKEIGATPRINELALVSGWYNPKINDYECLKILTHYTKGSMILDNKRDYIDIVYRLYAR